MFLGARALWNDGETAGNPLITPDGSHQALARHDAGRSFDLVAIVLTAIISVAILLCYVVGRFGFLVRALF